MEQPLTARSLFRFLPLVLLLGCGETTTLGIADRARITQAISQRVDIWTRAVNNRSVDTLAGLYAESADLAIFWPGGEGTRGAKAAAARWKSWADSLTQLNFVSADIMVDVMDRNVGVATFRTTTDAVVGRERRATRGRVTQVWVRDVRQDRWTIRAEHRSELPPAQ